LAGDGARPKAIRVAMTFFFMTHPSLKIAPGNA
jgi:hypothetical protein